MSHSNTLGHVLIHAGMFLHAHCRDWDAAESYAQQVVAISRDQNMPVWLIAGEVSLASVRIQKAPTPAHLDAFERSLHAYRSITKMNLFVPMFLCWRAESQAAAGLTEAGLASLDEAEHLAESQGDRFCEPEFHRLRGYLRLRGPDNDPTAAEADFHRAIGIADTLGTPFYKLRAATSLARLLGDLGRKGEARDALGPVHDWFTEGFDLPDLQDARSVLARVS